MIPTRDRNALLSRCLDHLAPELLPDDEIVVVDSASRIDDVRSVVESRGARYLRVPRRGTSLARNFGWEASSHPIVAFIDDDVLVQPGWAKKIRNELATGDVKFLIGSAYPDDESRSMMRTTLTEPFTLELGPATGGSIGLGCNGAILRTALLGVGGFDVRLGGGRFFGGEDVEIVDRLITQKVAGRYDPDLRAIHIMHGTRGHAVRAQWYYGLGMGGRYVLLLKRDPIRAKVVRRDVLRLRGMKTLAASLVGRGRSATAQGPSRRRPGDTGWLAPLAFRAGAVVGVVAASARLR